MSWVGEGYIHKVTCPSGLVYHRLMTRTPTPPDLGILLALAYQEFVRELHVDLAGHGYDDLGSSDGFVFRAPADRPMTVSALAVRLDISKQGAGQIIDDMEHRGYSRARAASAGRPGPAGRALGAGSGGPGRGARLPPSARGRAGPRPRPPGHAGDAYPAHHTVRRACPRCETRGSELGTSDPLWAGRRDCRRWLARSAPWRRWHRCGSSR